MHTKAAGPTSPRLIQTVAAYRRPLKFLQDCARRYGDIFTVRIATFPAPITFVSNPEVIIEIFAADGTDALEAGTFARPVMAKVIGEHALIVIDGEEHRGHRDLIMPYFMRRGFNALGRAILEVTDREIASWPAGGHFCDASEDSFDHLAGDAEPAVRRSAR